MWPPTEFILRTFAPYYVDEKMVASNGARKELIKDGRSAGRPRLTTTSNRVGPVASRFSDQRCRAEASPGGQPLSPRYLRLLAR